MTDNIEVGSQAEDFAQHYLEQQGLALVERNFRCRLGEIDLIMHEGSTLVFVEVRYRRNRDFGGPVISVSPRKQQKLRQVDVARKAAVRQALISDIENGATTARLDSVMRILSALDLDLSVVPRRKTGFDPTEY